jgi:hypothetical protein
VSEKKKDIQMLEEWLRPDSNKLLLHTVANEHCYETPMWTIHHRALRSGTQAKYINQFLG